MADDTLRIGLLQCGHVHADLVPANGDYPTLFADLLGPHGIELETYVLADGAFPLTTDECDGWLLSGSADSVYDQLGWIADAEDLVRRIVADGVPLVAVCFGHQLVAQALGGRVTKSDAGWGVGVEAYRLVGERRPWMDPAPPADGVVRLLASHQDQVVELPPGAELLASSDHCPVAAYQLGSRTLAIQPHPEFTKPISRGLIERRIDKVGPERAQAALDGLGQPVDRDLVGAWMARFLRATA